MSESYGQLVRDGWDAFNRGDLEAIRNYLHPDVKWHGGDPTALGSCQNRAQALRFMAGRPERLNGRSLPEIHDVIQCGDQVVVVLQPRDEHGEPEPLRANLTRFKDGLVVEMIACESPEQALALAAGAQ